EPDRVNRKPTHSNGWALSNSEQEERPDHEGEQQPDAGDEQPDREAAPLPLGGLPGVLLQLLLVLLAGLLVVLPFAAAAHRGPRDCSWGERTPRAAAGTGWAHAPPRMRGPVVGTGADPWPEWWLKC